jgi:hypothetical protein
MTSTASGYIFFYLNTIKEEKVVFTFIIKAIYFVNGTALVVAP